MRFVKTIVIALVSPLELRPALRFGSERASAWLHLLVLARRAKLDGLLVQGRCATTDARLELHAAQLVRLATRARLAAALRDSVRSVDETALTRRRRPQAPVDASSVRACAEEIADLARAVTDVDPRVRGLAIVSDQLTDGLGPLYTPGQTERLRNTVRAARSAPQRRCATIA